MHELVSDYGWSLALVAGLLGLMWLSFNWRRAVTVQRRIVIKAPPQAVWQAIDPALGVKPWREPAHGAEPIADHNGPAWRLHWRMRRRDGDAVTWTTDYAETVREPGRRLRLERIGIDGQPRDDKLLALDMALSPAAAGTAVTLRESWGRRSLAGIYSAHVDVAGQLSRLKSFCETGEVSSRRASARTVVISLLSALATIAAFSVLLGMPVALVLVFALLVHELGHLISFRLIGQPWGRIVFVPFLGAVSVARMPHRRLAEDVFCALMGAGLSLVLLLPAAWFALDGVTVKAAVAGAGWPLFAYACAALVAGLNLVNLLPIFPLDGGRYLRAVVQSLAPTRVRPIMFAVAAAFAAAALAVGNPLLLALAAIAFFQGRRLGPPRPGVAPMSRASMAALSAAYAALIALHGAALYTSFGVFLA